MKSFLLLLFFVSTGLCSHAQQSPVNTLPSGKYETVVARSQNKWEKGDIILLNNYQYKLTTTTEVGEYRFSATAQRVFFTSGPLKSVFARTLQNSDGPAILIPMAENEQTGLKLPSEVWGYLKQ